MKSNFAKVDQHANNDSDSTNILEAQHKTKPSSLLLQKEDVLAVPKRLTQTAQNLLQRLCAAPLPFHLEGRFGWRTHRLEDGRMGIPIQKELLLQKASEHEELHEFLYPTAAEEVQVSLLEEQPFFQSARARPPPTVDARIHPERMPNSALPLHPSTVLENPANTRATNAPLFTYAELFAGIGGFGVALEALGGRGIFVSELEESCRQVYQLNFPMTDLKHLHGDIFEVKDEDFPLPGTLDLLVGGFPCQPFSASGTQPGLQCASGRGTLFQQIVRTLKLSKPRGFLCENVPGLLTMKEDYDTIVSSFGDCGYEVSTEIYSARGLTATGRKRLFFVGLRIDLMEATTGTQPFEFPYVPDRHVRLENCLDYDELPSEELELLRLSNSTFQQLRSGQRWKASHLAWPNLVAETLTSHYGNSVGRGHSQLVPCHAPHNPRRMSVRECARLMGFPNDFQFPPQRANQGDMAYHKEGYRMVGNAVCPPLVAALTGALLSCCQLPHTQERKLDWIQKGLDSAVWLSEAATRSFPVELPAGCRIPQNPLPSKKKAKRAKHVDRT